VKEKLYTKSVFFLDSQLWFIAVAILDWLLRQPYILDIRGESCRL